MGPSVPCRPWANASPIRSCAKGGGGGSRAGRCPPRGWQQGRDQPTARGTVHVVRRCETLVRGGRRVGQEWVRDRGTPGAPTDRGRSNTDTQNAGATPGGTRASTANKEEGHSKAAEATRTAGTGNQNGADGRAGLWEAATIKGMAWPPGARATPAQPASGGGCLLQPRWAVCATGAGAHQGQTSREGEKDIWWTAGTVRKGTGHLGLTHTETQRGRLRTACGQRRVDSKNSQTTPATAHPQYANYWAPLTRKRHTMPHPAQPWHTNYWAPRKRKQHQQEHRPQRPTESSDPTQNAKGRTGDCPGPCKGATTRRNVTQGVAWRDITPSAAGLEGPAAAPWRGGGGVNGRLHHSTAVRSTAFDHSKCFAAAGEHLM